MGVGESRFDLFYLLGFGERADEKIVIIQMEVFPRTISILSVRRMRARLAVD